MLGAVSQATEGGDMPQYCTVPCYVHWASTLTETAHSLPSNLLGIYRTLRTTYSTLEACSAESTEKCKPEAVRCKVMQALWPPQFGGLSSVRRD